MFLDKLGISLLHPWLKRRAQIKHLPKATTLALRICAYEADTDLFLPAPGQSGKRKRRRRHFCPSSLDRKTADVCKECNEPCCVDHKDVTVLCSYCAA